MSISVEQSAGGSVSVSKPCPAGTPSEIRISQIELLKDLGKCKTERATF